MVGTAANTGKSEALNTQESFISEQSSEVSQVLATTANFGKVSFSMQDLFDVGAYFGHRANRWNPKMKNYIFGQRKGVHIIDTRKTYTSLCRALSFLYKIGKQNKKVLFVGTKKNIGEIVSKHALRCGQFYINKRWLGGTLTNWKTVANSIKTLRKIETQLSDAEENITKKQRVTLEKKRIKLDAVLSGIRNMNGNPDVIIVFDTNIEHLAISEASNLDIPIIAIADTNSNPDKIRYLIPGNDDSGKAVDFYCSLFSGVILEAMKDNMAESGVDISKLKGDSTIEDLVRAGDKNKEKENKEPTAAVAS